MYHKKIWIFKLLNIKIAKKIFLTGCCVGIVLILINTDELLNETSSSKMRRIDFHKWMEAMNLKMQYRRNRMEQNCRIANLDTRGPDPLHKPNEWEFIINRRYRIVWCNVFKAASTSWIYNLNILAGYREEFLKKAKDVPLQLLRKRYPRPSLKSLEIALNDSTSFLIVRHPFERLLSAYRDKIENSVPHSMHEKLAIQIILNYRLGEKNKIYNPYYLRHLKKKKVKPTFSEFVEYLIDIHLSGKKMDEHWIPITHFCTPCQVRFDVIMKFESLEDDQNYFIKRLNLQEKIRPQWQNPSKDKQNMNSLISKYYSQLNSTQIFRLYQIYRYDFYIFDYNVDKFLKYLSKSDAELILQDLKSFL